MSSQYDPALEALERKLNETEQAARGYRTAINALLELKGEKPRFPPDGGGGPAAGPSGGAAAGTMKIKSDTFFGKKMSTAIREYLSMRRTGGDGQPATPREIFDALKSGGYKFEAKNDEIALVSIRAMLRKNSPTFVKVGDGRYGLVAWYPEMRKPKATTVGRETSATDEEEDLDLTDDDEPLDEEDAA